MKEQEINPQNGPIELDLFTPAELAAHAMAAEAAESAEAEGAEQPLSDAKEATAGAGAETAARPATASAPREHVPHKKKKKVHPSDDPAKPKSFAEQIHEFINDDEDQPIRINFRGLIGGDGLPKFFKRNWVFISVIVFFTCIYVSCRYMMQSAVLEHDKLTEQLIDRRYKTLTLNSELMESTLSSHIEKNLKDSTIHTPTEQAYTLPTRD